MISSSLRVINAAGSVGCLKTVSCRTPVHQLIGKKFDKCFSSASSAAPRLASTLQSELQHERSNYEQATNIATYLDTSGWMLKEKEGDVNMTLTKAIWDFNVSVEFQLVSPNYTGEDHDSEAGLESQDTTDFSVACERSDGSGAIFYCTTVGNDEKFRFVVGNVRYFATPEEKTSATSYNGPEFEDLDDELQAGVDEWLASLGINEELCDFIDAMAVDKEQREYMRWLDCISKIVR